MRARRSTPSLIGRSATAAAVVLLASCRPAPDLPPAAALERCAAGLQVVPAAFQRPSLAGLSAAALDLKTIAAAECIDATAARNLGELEARTQRAARAMADYAAPLARRWWQLPPDDTEARAWAAHLEAGRQDMAAADAELTRLLDSQYALGIRDRTLDVDHQPLAAVALFDYARTVRALLGRTLHTRVVRLADNAFCAGDALAQRLLWKYFDAALRTRGGDRDALADSARALRALAVQTACLGDRQLFHLDVALTVAWTEVAERLQRHGLDDLLPIIEPAVLQARLVVFDADKHLGLSSPGLRWWYGRRELRDAIAHKVHWPFEDVMWFYDRRSAALAAIKTACRDGGSGAGCLNLPVFVESLARLPALGLGECSFLEMIEGGIRTVNGAPSYTCTPGVCGTPTRAGRIPDTALGRTFNAAYQPGGGGYRLPLAIKQTPFGVDLAEARGLLCGGASGGGFGGRDDAAGMGGPGMGSASAVLACVVGQKAEHVASLVPGAVCIARYTQATSPLTRAFEQMSPTAYAGIPKGCALSEDGGTPPKTDDSKKGDGKKGDSKKGEDPVKKNFEDTVKKVYNDLKNGTGSVTLDDVKKAIKQAYPGMTITDSDIEAAFNSLQNAGMKDTLESDDPAKTTAGQTTPDGQITVSGLAWLAHMGSGDKSNEKLLVHEFVHALMSAADNRGGYGASGGLLDSLIKSWSDTDHKVTNNLGLGGADRCVADSLGCNDRCNGMSTQVKEALACLGEAFSPTTVPPRPRDLVTDPIEPANARGAQMAACFASGGDIGGVIAVRQCSAVRCANASAGLGTAGCCEAGGLLASSGFGTRFTQICTVARCEPQGRGTGASASTGGNSGLGMCGCGGGYAPTPGSGPVVPPRESPFDVPLPPPGSPGTPGVPGRPAGVKG
jgi:hypothetical protein